MVTKDVTQQQRSGSRVGVPVQKGEDISVVKSTLGPLVCNNILFVNAFLGCDSLYFHSANNVSYYHLLLYLYNKDQNFHL